MYAVHKAKKLLYWSNPPDPKKAPTLDVFVPGDNPMQTWLQIYNVHTLIFGKLPWYLILFCFFHEELE